MAWFGRRSEKGRTGGPAGTSPVPPPSGDQTAALVRACTIARTLAVAVSWPHGGTLRCRFAELRDDELLLTVEAGAAEEFPALAVAAVSFHFHGRARVFLAPVLGFEEKDGRPRLIVRTPERISGAEARLAVRVPVRDNAGLSAELRTEDGDAVPVRPVDISVSGILVEIPGAAARELRQGELLRIRLEHGPRAALVDAVVRRRDGARYGLFFPGVLDRDDGGDTRAVREIVAPLEKRWLSER